jgi:transposase
MIDRRCVFEIHKLAGQGLSIRKIAKSLRLSRDSVAKYLRDPLPEKSRSPRASKLDPYKEEILRLLDMDPRASAPVIRQRISAKGYNGGVSMVRDYLAEVRPRPAARQAFIRFESLAGEQMQIDWGHFGSLTYGRTKRKLSCLSVLECHSRLLYLEFTHSQRQECLHRALLNAFKFMGGVCEEVVVDNMLTAVTERIGSVIRFNDAFLEFARTFGIVPWACNQGQAHEKGKVENVIKYIRHNFWPLRSFENLEDVQAQADHWRDTVANVRIHQTTGQRPVDRFQPDRLKPLPEMLPDFRETNPAKVHKDFSVRFDGNSYTVPPWAIGRTVLLKADAQTVSIYDSDQLMATHPRSWERKKRLEAPEHVEIAKRQKQRHWRSREVEAFIGLGPEAKNYLDHLAASGRSLRISLKKLLGLKDEYGRDAVIEAINRAEQHRAYGADYIENILYQEMTPQRIHPPVKLFQNHLNQIRLPEPCLAEYDALVVERRKEHDCLCFSHRQTQVT